MTSITHPELVVALAKPGADIAASMTAKSADMLHHAVGVAGECGELLIPILGHPINVDRENLVEEIGDLEFYMEGLRQNLGITREETMAVNDEEFVGLGLLTLTVNLTIHGCNLLDLAKKAVIYEKEPDRQKFVKEMISFESALRCIRDYLSITYEETIEANIAKLSVRYASGGFSNAEAEARADKAA